MKKFFLSLVFLFMFSFSFSFAIDKEIKNELINSNDNLLKANDAEEDDTYICCVDGGDGFQYCSVSSRSPKDACGKAAKLANADDFNAH